MNDRGTSGAEVVLRPQVTIQIVPPTGISAFQLRSIWAVGGSRLRFDRFDQAEALYGKQNNGRQFDLQITSRVEGCLRRDRFLGRPRTNLQSHRRQRGSTGLRLIRPLLQSTFYRHPGRE